MNMGDIFVFARLKIYEPQEIDLEAATNHCHWERVVRDPPMHSPCLLKYLPYLWASLGLQRHAVT